MKWLFYLLVFFVFSSCVDFNRSKQLDAIDKSIEELRINRALLKTSLFDSIPIVLPKIEALKTRLRAQLKNDTLSLRIALKIDEFKKIESDLKNIELAIPIAEKDIENLKTNFSNLKKDIENSVGQRGDYKKNIAVEIKKKDTLINAINRYKENCASSFVTLKVLHIELSNFTDALELKNKEQNLIP